MRDDLLSRFRGRITAGLPRAARLTSACGAGACLALAGCGSGARTQARSDGMGAVGVSAAALSAESPLLETPRYHRPVSELTLAEIALELEAMASLDHRLLGEVYSLGRRDGRDSSQTDARVREIDRAHAQRLEQIVDAIGWPTTDLVGDRAAKGAFLVVQHAGFDPDFQTSCLELMHQLVDERRLPAAYAALLTDRVRMYRDQPQLFGTQMTFLVDEAGLARAVPSVPVEDPANLDNRRAMMGMPSHAQFVRTLENAFARAGVGGLPAGGAYAAVGAD